MLTVFPLMMPTLSSLCNLLIYTRNMLFLLDSKNIDSDDRNIFQRIKAGEASLPDLSRALSTLMKILNAYYASR